MSGFETGNSQGIVSRGKQFGSILRGSGPPAPQAGVLGDVYIDNVSFQLFGRREGQGLDPWGHYLFVVPMTYHTNLKYFGTTVPPSNLGVTGDYYVQWGGYPNYGLDDLIVYGPKAGSWGSGTPVSTSLNSLYTAEDEYAVS